MHGGAVSCLSRLQPTVAALTVEAEYMGAAAAVKEALWFRKLARDIGLEIGGVQILCDNQGAMKLLKHPIASQRSKHIDVLHHFARERVARREVEFVYCPTSEMAANFFTKAVPVRKFSEVLRDGRNLLMVEGVRRFKRIVCVGVSTGIWSWLGRRRAWEHIRVNSRSTMSRSSNTYATN
jgi:hypothetical protein